jgi:predicted SnoaL-like aldol condensation-catalyzing enzyme
MTNMKPIKTLVALAALLAGATAVAPALAQEPVVAAVDPEALFTANKQVVLHILREILQCNHWDEADKYLTQRYLQHNPNVHSGLANVIKYFGPPPRTPVCGKLSMPVVTVLTSGNIVGIVFRAEYDDPRAAGKKYTSISYDQWRIVDGKADEHWDTAMLDAPK